MIRMLPEGLFYDMVMRIGAIFVAGLAVLLVLSFIPKILDRKKEISMTYN